MGNRVNDLPSESHSKAKGVSRNRAHRSTGRVRSRQISSEEAIRAGEKIAMTAFASGLKLAAAFGTVAAKTAGLALSSLATGADKFSELVREEARRSHAAQANGLEGIPSSSVGTGRKGAARKKASR